MSLLFFIKFLLDATFLFFVSIDFRKKICYNMYRKIGKEINMKTRTFFIGDPHFFDENIIKYENRPFNSVEEMNTEMILNWNKVVKPDDIIYVNGDFFDFNNCTGPEATDIINKLNGKIILIVGNHDREYTDFFEEHLYKVIDYPIILDEFWIVSHEPLYINENMPYANIFAHIHNNPMYKTVSKRSFCTSTERNHFTPILFDDIKKAVMEENKYV
jgi:calcineurin-like phosphoesterase family protein